MAKTLANYFLNEGVLNIGILFEGRSCGFTSDVVTLSKYLF